MYLRLKLKVTTKEKMMNRTVLPLTIMVLITLAGCEEDLNGDYESPSGQAVLFEYHYINHAWGYADHGWLVDANGNVRSFEYPEGFRLPDSTNYISGEDLNQNLSQCDSIVGKIGKEDLYYYTSLISGASGGEISAPENIAADAGISVLSCYYYDSTKDMYRYVLLASSGDWQQSNDAPEAEILVNWLKELGEVIWLSD